MLVADFDGADYIQDICNDSNDLSDRFKEIIGTSMRDALLKSRISWFEKFLKTEKGLKSFLIKNKKGITPLHYAAENGRSEVVNEILKFEEGLKSVLIQTKEGKAPLHYAIENGCIDIIRELVKAE